MLQLHSKVAITTLEHLSKTQARQFAKALTRVNGLPWKILILIDSTLQHRASLHPENTKTFHHGKGDVIGHQWTNIVLLLGDMLMPLRPIPFYSKRYCQAHDLAYHSEHEHVVEYLRTLDLEDSIGAYERREVLVFADSGYDDKKIEKAIADQRWHCIIALSKTRSVKSEALYLTTPTSRQWCHIDTFFRRHRRLKWDTIRLATSGNKRQRMDFRVRHTSGYLRYVGKVELVCSEQRNRPDGRRKYLACNDLRATIRQIVTGYRLRWAVELFITLPYWIRYSLTAMIFAGVFDRYPRLRVGSVEHETAWIPHWLKQMDLTYRERPTLTRGWKSRQGLLPSDYWHRNMFVEFMEDDYGVRLRDVIGVDNMLWGNDFPHAESTWPMSREFLDRIFAGAPEADRRQITADNAAQLFRFRLG